MHAGLLTPAGILNQIATALGIPCESVSSKHALVAAYAPMARFYLHLRSEPDTFDEEGIELRDEAAARDVARRAIADIIAEDIAEGRPVILHHAITIEDESHQMVGAVAFGGVLRVIS